MPEPSHLDAAGRAQMVDIAHKPETERQATAACRIHLSAEAVEQLRTGRASKGDVLATARIAGISAGKRTSELIPLCHPLRTTSIALEFELGADTLDLTAVARGVDRTGMEMEAMTAAGVAALTVYDMLKAVDRSMTITDLRLIEKTGGKSGLWRRDQA